jgi:hypothetical protein
MNLWPKEFDVIDVEDQDHQEGELLDYEQNDYGDDDVDTDGIVYDQGYDQDEDLILNTNRAAKVTLEDSSEDESE